MDSIGGLPLWANGLIVVATTFLIGLGAHWVVEAAARIAKSLGISEIIVGLTVVAFGTSAPEFAVTLIAAFQGHGDMSVGNIIGSNLLNLGFILGVCVLARGTPIAPALLKRDGTVIGVTTLLLLALIGWDLRLDRFDGVLLFVLWILYLGYLFKQRRAGVDNGHAPEAPGTERTASLARDSLLLVAGLIGIIGGSHLLVESATVIARGFGASEWLIGVTIVAAGTSAPELATSLSGVIKRRYAISMGNAIGSYIFNLLGVLGLAGLLRPMDIDATARVYLGVLCGLMVLVLFFMRTLLTQGVRARRC